MVPLGVLAEEVTFAVNFTVLVKIEVLAEESSVIPGVACVTFSVTDAVAVA
jgi:hypothetical protein